MKIRSHVAAGAMAMALVIGSSMCVYAAPSATAVETATSNQYEVSDVTKTDYFENELKDEHPVVHDVITDVNSGKIKTVEEFTKTIVKDTNAKTKKSADKIQARLKDTVFLTKFFDLHVKYNENASNKYLHSDEIDVEKSKDGKKFRVTLNVPTLTKNNKDVFVLHFIKGDDDTEEAGTWETIEASEVDYEKKTIVVEFDSFSPASVLAAVAMPEETQEELNDDPVEEEEEKAETTGKKSDDDDDDDDDSSSSKSTAKSPKTGVADTWVLWFAASAVLAGAAKSRR